MSPETPPFASARLTMGQVNAAVKKLGGHEGVLRFLRDETEVVESKRIWREEESIIYFSVKSDGTTGKEWINRLENEGFRIKHEAELVLGSKDFKSTPGLVTEIAVLNGLLFKDSDRTDFAIRRFAERRNLVPPNLEVACLIREALSDREIEMMGLSSIVVMHNPVEFASGERVLLSVERAPVGNYLAAHHVELNHPLFCGHGFAFEVWQK